MEPRDTDIAVNRTRRRWRMLRTLAGIAVSGLLLAWIFTLADWTGVVQALRKANLLLVVLSALAGYAALPLRTEQWRLLLTLPREVPFLSAFKAVCLGHLGNCVFPLQGGEVVRSYVLAKETGLSFARVFSSVIAGRFQDFLPIALLIGVLLMFGVPDSLPAAVVGDGTSFQLDVKVVAGALMGTALVFMVATAVYVVFAYQQEKLAGWCCPSLIDSFPKPIIG